MIGSLSRQSTLFYVAFGQQADLIRDDVLDTLDVVLDDPELIELVRERLASRSERSADRGRTTIAPDRLLRCCGLKHVKGWSFRELESELRKGLAYRKFTRFHEDSIPNYSVFSRVFALLGTKATRAIHSRIVAKAKEEKVAPGRKLRTDTTVVETNIHHPTDSSLLGDGIRVLTRCLSRIADECDAGALKVVDHARAMKHRLLEIDRAAKSKTQAAQERLKSGYVKLLELGKQVVRQAVSVTERLAGRARERLRIIGSPFRVEALKAQVEHFVPMVKQVMEQTKARVLEGNARFAGKVLSLFEPSTAVICKGKTHKPTEFGRLVRVDEVENGIVSNYAVQEGNPSDVDAWEPAILQHKAQYGSAPRLATGDRGFFAARNEKLATEAGVKQVAVPARGVLSTTRKALQKQRWFRRAMRWRTGIEARIGTLKNVFAMKRAMYKGDSGIQRYVGWSVIANNLVSMARTLIKRKAKEKQSASSEC
jgi:IS5 family transposase